MTHAERAQNQTPAASRADLQRVLGPFDATCVVIGAIIGVGIFFTPSRVAAIAGSLEFALLAWVVGGAIALAGALTFAALGQTYHNAGAQYEILRDAYGPLPAFVFVFCNATAIQAGAIAVIADFCAKNLTLLVAGAPPGDATLTALSILLIAGLMAANTFGVRLGSGIQNATVVAKVLTLAILVAFALLAPTPPAAPPPENNGDPRPFNGLAIIFAAIIPAFFAYGGWQHALWISGEIRDPRRNIPLAIILGVSVVVVVYLATNWALFKLLGYDAVVASPSPAVDAAGAVWGELGRQLVAGAMTVSAFGVLNAQLLSGPRLVYRMACDGRFFAPFARLNSQYGTPVWAIGLLGFAAIVLLLGAGPANIGWLLAWVVIIDSVFFLLTGAALFILRSRRTANAPPRAFGHPLAPLLFVLGEAGILAGACVNPDLLMPALFGAGWILVTIVLYWVRFRRNEQPEAAATSSPRR